MKKRNLLVLAGVLLLVLLIELYATGAFSSLQGRLSVSPATLDNSRGPVYSLAASSPSGRRIPSTSDTDIVFIFDASGSGRLSIPSETTFGFIFETDLGDFMVSDLEDISIGLYLEENLVGERTILEEDGTSFVTYECTDSTTSSGDDSGKESYCEYFVEVALNRSVWLGSGTKTFELVVDTTALLEEDLGEDDRLDITMTVGSQEVQGNTLIY